MKIVSFIIIIILTPIIFLTSYRLLVYDQNFYEQEFLKLGVYEKFESKEIVIKQTKSLLNYYCCKSTLDSSFYTQREIIHIQDVKKLIKSTDILLLSFTTFFIVLFVALVFRKKYDLLFRTFLIAPAITIISLIVLWLTTITNFNFIFIKFHLISFQNDYWLLPESANLIKLFPQQFFVDFANQVAFNTAKFSLVIIILNLLLSKKYATKKY